MPLPLAQPKKSSFKKIIGVAAGKGGVGKSFVAAALARMLVKKGFKTALLDADFYGPSLKKMIPEEKGPYQEEGKWIPARAEGLSFLSLAHFYNETESLAARAPLVAKWLRRFINETCWGDNDFLIIDFPPGTGDIPLDLAQNLPLSGVILVTTPQEVAVLDVKKAASMFTLAEVPILGIVENMAYYEDPATHNKIELFGKGGGEKLSALLNVPLLTSLPLDPEMGRLTDLGLSFLLSKEGRFAPFIEGFDKIISALTEYEEKEEVKSIFPTTPYTFAIEWAEGIKEEFLLSDLEANCPCAGCKKDKKPIPQLTAKGIRWVGRFAFQIDFDKGCNKGIYTVKSLKNMGRIL
jgi:ATP-binding protein involved in chromosome partitioning